MYSHPEAQGFGSLEHEQHSMIRLQTEPVHQSRRAVLWRRRDLGDELWPLTVSVTTGRAPAPHAELGVAKATAMTASASSMERMREGDFMVASFSVALVPGIDR